MAFGMAHRERLRLTCCFHLRSNLIQFRRCHEAEEENVDLKLNNTNKDGRWRLQVCMMLQAKLELYDNKLARTSMTSSSLQDSS